MNQESKVDRDEKEDALSNLADAASQSFLGEVWYLVVSHKRWILLPIVIAIVVLGVLVMLSSSGVGPFIYTLFQVRVLTDRALPISPGAYWELLMNLTKREVKGRYSQSFFGIAWAIAQPLATMAVFTIVFSRLAQMPSDGVPYPIFAYAALVPWFFFSNSVASGTLSLITYRNIVTKTYFPREVVPLAQVCSRFIDFFAAAALYAVLLVYYRITLGPWALAAPLFFLLLIVFTVGVTMATSAVNVFYRDVNPVVQIALQLWLYLTPVAYPLSRVSARFRPLFLLNPLSAVVEGFRSSLVFNRPPDWPLTGIAVFITAALFASAFAAFKRMDKYFADVI